MNRDFRSCILKDLRSGVVEVIDLTRYALPASEPRDMTRRRSLMGIMNQKHARAQDAPRLFHDLSTDAGSLHAIQQSRPSDRTRGHSTTMRIPSLLTLSFFVAMLACQTHARDTGFPAPGYNKVAYYVFDSGGPDRYPMTSFTDEANIVIVFEGTLWELADSAHYATGWMRNVNYHSHAEVLRDIRALQARGVKVLMNVDDAASWSTATPFTTHDGKKLTAAEFAAFIKACAIDSVGLDGISLDIEHKATANADYVGLLKEIGKYFGPRSSNSTTQMYIAAIYSGGAPGPAVGKSKDITSYMNFIMDMAYFNADFGSRFRQWADSIGASKMMVGMLNDYFDLAHATSAAAWQPAVPPKAGIMVYAANNSKAYTDAVFKALVVGPLQAAEPFPADNATGVSTTAQLRWKGDPTAAVHAVYLGSGGVLEKVAEQSDTTFDPGPLLPNTLYYWRIDEKNAIGTTIGKVWKFTTGSGTDVDGREEANPSSFALLQNFPNPFNAGTVIGFTVGGVSASHVRLTVCDMLGREIATLVDEARMPGTHRISFDASHLASGMYLYRLHAGGIVRTRKLVLVR